jgi:hypothetical protein
MSFRLNATGHRQSFTDPESDAAAISSDDEAIHHRLLICHLVGQASTRHALSGTASHPAGRTRGTVHVAVAFDCRPVCIVLIQILLVDEPVMANAFAHVADEDMDAILIHRTTLVVMVHRNRGRRRRIPATQPEE